MPALKILLAILPTEYLT